MFNILNRYRMGSRYLRNAKTGPIGAALDLSVTPTFPSLGTVAGLATTPSASGGTLASATYQYQVTGLNARGETLPQAQVPAVVTGPTGSVGLAWTALAGATGYNIYRGGLLLATVGAVTAYTDTGAIAPAGAINAIDSTSVIAGATPGMVIAGDLVYRTANGIASLNTPGAGNANAASCLGQSEDTYPLVLGLGTVGGLGRPDNDPMGVRIAIRQSGEFAFDTTPGETYRPGDLLYLGADAQTVTKVVLGVSIAKVADDQSPVLNGSDGMSVPIVGGIAAGGLAQRVCVQLTPALAV